MIIKWGDPIECNGVRPDWLREDEPAEIENAPGEWLEWSGCVWHHYVTAIRLPADHPAYVALARGFHPWSGGESAPDDWDAAQPVLFRNGGEYVSANFNWAIPHMPSIGETPADIIGYRKRSDSRTDYVRIAPMTLDEWKTIQFHPGATTWAQSVGLIRPETTAERFTRETGHAVTEAVEAALNWKGE